LAKLPNAIHTNSIADGARGTANPKPTSTLSLAYQLRLRGRQIDVRTASHSSADRLDVCAEGQRSRRLGVLVLD